VLQCEQPAGTVPVRNRHELQEQRDELSRPRVHLEWHRLLDMHHEEVHVPGTRPRPDDVLRLQDIGLREGRSYLHQLQDDPDRHRWLPSGPGRPADRRDRCEHRRPRDVLGSSGRGREVIELVAAAGFGIVVGLLDSRSG
jgi:hypothetical protein